MSGLLFKDFKESRVQLTDQRQTNPRPGDLELLLRGHALGVQRRDLTPVPRGAWTVFLRYTIDTY